MRLPSAIVPFAALLLFSLNARAQSVVTLSDFSSWMRAGPTLIVAGATPAFEHSDELFGLARVGILGGFFIRPEVTLTRASLGRDGKGLTGAAGLRILPLGFRAGEGFSLGGGRGHSLGVLGGKGISGWYFGATYEWKPCDFGGLVIELTKDTGGPLASPATLNVGLQFSMPARLP